MAPQPRRMPGFYAVRNQPPLAAPPEGEVLPRLEAARALTNPQERLSALMFLVDHIPEAVLQHVVITEAIAAAKAIPDMALGTWLLAVGPLRWLVLRGNSPVQVAEGLNWLIAMRESEPQAGAGIFLLAKVLDGEYLPLLQRALNVLGSPTRNPTAWRSGRALVEHAMLWNPVDRGEAVAIADLIESPRLKRKALRAIGALDHPDLAEWMRIYGSRQR